MKNLFYFIGILLLNNNIVFGQSNRNVNSEISVFESSLTLKGISKIISIRHFCLGIHHDILNDQECDYSTEEFQEYIFWQTKDSIYIKKFDNCGEYKSISIKNFSMLDSLKVDYLTIKLEEIEPNIHTDTTIIYQQDTIWINSSSNKGQYYLDTSKVINVTKTQFIIDHNCHRKIWIYLNGYEPLLKHINLYDLNPTSGEGIPNDNYDNNLKLNLTNLCFQMDKVIKELEGKKIFQRKK